VGCRDGSDRPSRTVSVSLDRLQRLEACEARVDLQEQHIELLQRQIAETDAALKLELARGEKHAEALMHIARTCDERTSEMKEQHAMALRVTAKVEDENTALKTKLLELTASHAVATSKLEAQKEAIIELKAEVTALKAQAASTLTEIHTAVTTGTMEIFPVRPSDSRQFAERRAGGIPPPPPPQFDRAWCAAVCAGGWEADIDAADARATVTINDEGSCTLRSAAPLPRLGPAPRAASGGPQLPAYRVVVERWGGRGECWLGFVPSHEMHGSGHAAAVAPNPDYGIHNYGGWYILVDRSDAVAALTDTTSTGWAVMAPGASAYATTTDVPPVPEGGAVEFAVDYAAGTCRVAFYTPAAVAGGFVEAPHAKMELRFVATTASEDCHDQPLPARTVPTATDSVVALYPAVETCATGIAWRFAAAV
jgi:hypothetical protein